MIIKKVFLHNYRNYIDQIIEFDKQVNFITGKNAQGKTNIIESIYYASYGKSFRNGKDYQLIRAEQKNMQLGIDFETQYGNKKIEIRMNDQKQKEIKVNKFPINRTSELIGNLNVTIFSPDDLKLIKEGPSLRRKFINREISQTSKIYYDSLVNYHKILDQRNNYLKKTSASKIDKLYIETLDEKLVEYGVKIIVKRMAFVDLINQKAQEIHLDLSEKKELLKIEYVSSIITQNPIEYGKIEEKYFDILKRNFDKDLKYQYTTFGPHRDDLNIQINNKDLKTYGSQGQIRTAALSIVLAVLNITIDEIGENPILLLDDVFSELDQRRKNILVKFVNGIQTFITTTDLDGIDLELFDKSTVFIVDNGSIRRS